MLFYTTPSPSSRISNTNYSQTPITPVHVHATFEGVDLVLQLLTGLQSAKDLTNRTEVINKLKAEIRRYTLRFDNNSEQWTKHWDKAVQSFHSKWKQIASWSKLDEIKKAIAKAEKIVKDDRSGEAVSKAKIYQRLLRGRQIR